MTCLQSQTIRQRMYRESLPERGPGCRCRPRKINPDGSSQITSDPNKDRSTQPSAQHLRMSEQHFEHGGLSNATQRFTAYSGQLCVSVVVVVCMHRQLTYNLQHAPVQLPTHFKAYGQTAQGLCARCLTTLQTATSGTISTASCVSIKSFIAKLAAFACHLTIQSLLQEAKRDDIHPAIWNTLCNAVVCVSCWLLIVDCRTTFDGQMRLSSSMHMTRA